MPHTLSVPPRELASVPTTPTSNNNNNNNNNSKNNNRPHRQDSSSTSMTHLSPAFPRHHYTQTSTTAPTTTAQPSPSSSHSSSLSHSFHTSTALTTGAIAGERGTEVGTAVAVRMDASPVILFTLQYSVAVVQGVTIYILSVVFSILQLVSGQLNDPPSSSGSTHSGSGAKKKGLGSGDEEQHQRRQQRRRRWSGSGSGTTSMASTSGASWAQNLIAHTQQIQAQSQTNPAETHGNAPTGGAGGGGTLTQRVEALRFLGTTIANLVGSYARLTTSSPAFSSTGENIESVPQKRLLASSMSIGAGGAGPGRQGEVEMSYSSRIRRALVKTLSGHANPLPRSMKRVTFNDTLQFHTTTTNRRPRARFGDGDDEEDEDGDEEEEGSSPVLLRFSGEFGAGATLLPEESMSTSLTSSVPLLVLGGGGKKVKKNRPPSILPSARDRRQLQEQDDLEDMAAAVQETDARSGGFSVVPNGRSIPVSTTAMRPGFSTSTGKILASTITIALPPLSRPRKQQQQPQTPTSPVMTIAATSTTTTTTSMTPTSYSPTNGTSGLASALLSSLMMPASTGPISDVARSLLSPTTLEASAPVLSDSDSSKSSSGGRGRGNLKKPRSAPSKISTFLQQHRGQMQGLFSLGEYTSSPGDVSSPLLSATVVVANAEIATETESTVPSSATASVDSPTASSTTTAPTVRARQTSTSSTKTLIRPRSLYSIQSTVSSAVAAVIGEEPPPSVPVSLTTSMSHSLSPRLGPTTFSPTHQRKRSASVDLTNIPSLRLQSSSSMEAISTPGLGNALEPSTPTSSGSGGRSLMYKLTHPQRYKRELELQLQSQHQKDTGSLSSATSSPSASQVALTPLSPTGSATSIQRTLQETPSALAAVVATTTMVYPFSRSFADLPASLSYLSDDPHPTHLPPPHTYSSMSVEPTSPPATAFEATAETHHFPLPLTPPPSDKDTILAAAWESTFPPLFFPSPTTQHHALAPLPSPAHSSSSSPTTTTATSSTVMLSSMKDSLAQLRRSPPPRPRSMEEDEDNDGVGAHTTFAACGFSLASSSSSS